MKTVTIARLKKLDACALAVNKLRKAFGRRIVITPANLTRAEKEYDGALAWFVQHEPALKAKYGAGAKKGGQCRQYEDNKNCWSCAGHALARRILLRAARG